MKEKLAFWGALFILLTSISPILEAATIDPTTYPWEFDATFRNAPQLESLNIDQSILTFTDTETTPSGTLLLDGFIGVQSATRSWGVADVKAWQFTNDFVIMGMRWGALDFELKGIQIEEGRWIGGLRGLGASDINGTWEALQLELPTTLGLFVMSLAIGGLFIRKTA